MRWHVLVPLVCSLLVVSAGCRKRETPKPVPRASKESNRAQIDACRLLTKKEIEAIQKKVIDVIEDSVTFAEESPYLDPSELYVDVYKQKDYPYITD